MLSQIFTVTFLTAFFSAAVRLAVPIAYGGLGEIFAEKAGVLNIGMEGVMLSGAFFSFAGAWFSKSFFIGLLCGIAGGLLVSLLHGLLSIFLAKDQSVSGLTLNLFLLGITGFLYKRMSSGQDYQQIHTLPALPIPLLCKIPVLGDVFFNQDALTYGLYILLAASLFFYKKTNMGLSLTAIGENPEAAASAGISVHACQWMFMGVNGILGGIGGAYLVLVQLGIFTEDMISGRGYIALATVILGRYSAFGMWGAALLFGTAGALQIRLQTIGVTVSPYLLAVLPYAITLLAMLGSIGRDVKPEALGRPYRKGSR